MKPFNPSKWTHPVVNTHTHTHTPQSRHPGSSWGPCSRVSSHDIEGGDNAGYLLSPLIIPAGSESRAHNLRVTSPTLTIKPRLPQNVTSKTFMRMRIRNRANYYFMRIIYLKWVHELLYIQYTIYLKQANKLVNCAHNYLKPDQNHNNKFITLWDKSKWSE